MLTRFKAGEPLNVPQSEINRLLGMRLEQMHPTNLTIRWFEEEIRKIFPDAVNYEWYTGITQTLKEDGASEGTRILEHCKKQLISKWHNHWRVLGDKKNKISTPLYYNRFFQMKMLDTTERDAFKGMIEVGDIDGGIQLLAQHGTTVTEDEHQKLSEFSRVQREEKCFSRMLSICTESPFNAYESNEFDDVFGYFEGWNKDLQEIFLLDQKTIRTVLDVLRKTIHENCIVGEEQELSLKLEELWEFYLDQIKKIFLERSPLVDSGTQLPLALDVVGQTRGHAGEALDL